MKNGRHIAEFYGVGVMLAIVGGYLDAYTYISRDHVFANAQTGNMVLLAINIKEGSWLKVFLYLMPILSFMLGVLIVEAVKLKFNEHPRIHWHRIIIGVELVVLTIVGFIPAGTLNTLANILVSFTCAMQVEGFRKMDGKPFATTMCTGNLRSGTEHLFHWFFHREGTALEKVRVYYGLIGSFIAGAVLSGLLTPLFAGRTILAALVPLLSAFLIMLRGEKRV